MFWLIIPIGIAAVITPILAWFEQDFRKFDKIG